MQTRRVDLERRLMRQPSLFPTTTSGVVTLETYLKFFITRENDNYVIVIPQGGRRAGSEKTRKKCEIL